MEAIPAINKRLVDEHSGGTGTLTHFNMLVPALQVPMEDPKVTNVVQIIFKVLKENPFKYNLK